MLGPAFLQADDVGDRRGRGFGVGGVVGSWMREEVADVREAGCAVFGEVEESPAVEGGYVDLVVGLGGRWWEYLWVLRVCYGHNFMTYLRRRTYGSR